MLQGLTLMLHTAMSRIIIKKGIKLSWALVINKTNYVTWRNKWPASKVSSLLCIMDNVYFVWSQREKVPSLLRNKETSEIWRAVKTCYLAFIFRTFRRGKEQCCRPPGGTPRSGLLQDYNVWSWQNLGQQPAPFYRRVHSGKAVAMGRDAEVLHICQWRWNHEQKDWLLGWFNCRTQ